MVRYKTLIISIRFHQTMESFHFCLRLADMSVDGSTREDPVKQTLYIWKSVISTRNYFKRFLVKNDIQHSYFCDDDSVARCV